MELTGNLLFLNSRDANFSVDETFPVPCEDGDRNSSDSDDSDVVTPANQQEPAKRKRMTTRRGKRGAARGHGHASRGRGGNRSGRGRKRSQPHGIACNIDGAKSYDDPDRSNQLPPFTPTRQPGLHIDRPITRNMFTKAIDFFRLFFTAELLHEICTHTNAYGWIAILKKPYYGDKQGAWIETTVEEIEKLIALILYFGLVNVSSFHRYWSTKTLYHGLWARKIMSRDRFKALMATLHIVDPSLEDDSDKLRKVRSFIQAFKDKCKLLYEPFQKVAVDERMVKSKHRSGIRQYIKNKPTKWGVKLWVLADSSNGYTCDFDIYIGKNSQHEVSAKGLGYDVVMKLVGPLVNQGYHLYFDNFYTSVQLVQDLWEVGIPACGTAAENRRGFPVSMKNGKDWAKGKDRGNMRWHREGVCLAVQWKDNRVVTMLSTIDTANKYVMVDRKEKIDNKWQTIQVKQPQAIHSYNQFMNGVDRSDQILAKNNTLRKCMRWWKTLFFHIIDIAVVNSFILFQLYRNQHPEIEELCRPQKYSTLEFREELVRQLAGLEEYGLPPVYMYSQGRHEKNKFETEHVPEVTPETKRNCRVCYETENEERKVVTQCNAPQCQVYLHITKNRNCFKIWHSKEYQQKRKT